jgi:hypothetical protein
LQESTTNRDRFAKLTQYGLKVVSHLLSVQHDALTELGKQKMSPMITQSLARLDTLMKTTAEMENDVSMARKVFSFFKWLTGYIAMFEFYRKLMRIQIFKSQLRTGSINDAPERITLVELLQLVSKVLLAHVNMLDNFNWMAKVGILYDSKRMQKATGIQRVFVNLFNNGRAADYGRKGCWLWLCAILTNLIIDTINTAKVIKNQIVLSSELEKLKIGNLQLCQCEYHYGKSSEELRCELQKTIDQRDKLIINYVKNFCDLFISTTGVNITNFNKGVVGILGCLVTLIGVWESWK